MEQSKKSNLKWYEKYGYGFGGLFSYSFYLMLQAYFLLYFLTDELHFSTAVAATIYSATQWIKVITMILAGTIIDSTNFKLGKYRSWVAIGAVLTTVFATIVFWKFNIPTTAAVILFVTAYILQSFGYNSMWTASRALVGPMAKTSADAVALTGAAQSGSSLGGIIYGLINTSIVAAWAFTGQSYGMTMLCYGLLICVGTIVMLYISKPYDIPAASSASAARKAEKVGLLTMLKSLRGPMIPYFFAMTFGSAQSGFFFALLSYFTRYVLENPAVMSYAVTAYSVMGVLGALSVRPVMNVLKNKKATYIFATGASAVLYFLIRMIGANAVVFTVLYALVGFFGSFAGVLLPAFANDLADYQEMKGEGSARAFVQSVAGVTIRLAAVLSTSIAAFGLAAIGYQNGTTPEGSMLTGITNMMVVGPVIVCVLACVCILFYRVDEKQLDAYRAKRSANQ